MRTLTKALHGSGVRTFVLSFHAPSLKPGCTPYVLDERDRERFLDHGRQYLEWFLKDFGGVAMTSLELRQHILDLTTTS